MLIQMLTHSRWELFLFVGLSFISEFDDDFIIIVIVIGWCIVLEFVVLN